MGGLVQRQGLACRAAPSVALPIVSELIAAEVLLSLRVDCFGTWHDRFDAILLTVLAMLAVRIAGIGNDGHLIGSDRRLALQRHWMKLLQIVAVVGQLESNDQIMLGIDRNLRIVSYLMATRRTHELGLGFAQHLLLEPFPNQLFGLPLQLRALCRQCRNGRCNVDGCWFWRGLLRIGFIHRRQILGDLALNRRIPLCKLCWVTTCLRLATAAIFVPSTARSSAPNTDCLRQNSMKARHTPPIASG